MTQHKHFKALVRARMARTGERYAIARRHLTASIGIVRLEPLTEIHAHTKHAIAVAFTPDGRDLLSGGFGGEAKIWSPTDGAQRGELSGHTTSVNGFAFTPDGDRVVTVSSDGTIRVWDLASRRGRTTIRGHAKGAVAVDVAADGAIVTGGYDGTVRRWSSEGDELARLKIGAWAVAVAAHPSDGSIATSPAEPQVHVLDATGATIRTLAARDVVSSLRWSPDGASLVAGTCRGVEVWAADTWERVRTIPLADGDASVVPVAPSPDGALLAVGWAHHVGVWRADADEAAVTVDGLPKGVYCVAFSPDASMLAACAADGVVRVWAIVRDAT
jgi:WD40 repeat protein